MSGPSFTPGPWSVERVDYDLHGMDASYEVNAGFRTIVQTHMREIKSEGEFLEADEANCRLITAAPDMFDALKLAAEELATIAVSIGEDGWSAVSIERHDSICAVGDKIAAILAKARGEAA